MNVAAYEKQSTAVALNETRDIRFRATGITAKVSDDPRAKLMYYLNCMCSVLNLTDVHPEVQRLRDYERHDLNRKDIDTLIKLCLVLAPQKLENKCIFECPELCANSNNEFYTVEDIQKQVLSARTNSTVAALARKSTLFASETVTLTIVLEGKSYKIAEIMTYKRNWMQNYYHTPMKLLRRNTDICILQ